MNEKKFLYGIVRIILTFSCFNSVANVDFLNPDSLKNVVQNTKNDTQRINAINALCFYYIDSDPFVAIEYGNKSIVLGEELKILPGVITAQHYLGYIYKRQGNYSKSLEYFLEALEISKSNNFQTDVAFSLKGIGDIYSEKKDLINAEKYYRLTIQKFEENYNDAPNEVYKNSYLDGVANTWNDIAQINVNQKKYDEAIVNYNKSLDLFIQLKNDLGIGTIYNNIGELLEKQNNDTYIDYFLKADSLFEKVQFVHGIGVTSVNIGQFYVKKGDYSNAIDFIYKGISNLKEIKNYDALSKAYLVMSESYDAMGNDKNSLQYFKLFYAIKDSLFNVESSRILTEMQTKFETKEKDHELELQSVQINRKNTYILLLIIMVFLFVIFFMLIFWQYRLRQSQKELAIQQKLLRSQMNPHFIFNSLNAIQNFVFENKSKEAASYLARFAKLMRMILESSRDEYISMSKEIETIENYLELQLLRLNNSFEYSINVNEDIDTDFTLVPPMLIQPFIENSIEHAFPESDEKKGKIIINVINNENRIIFEIIDNGIGLEKSGEVKSTKKKGHISMATTITKERLIILNKGSKGKILFNLEDLSLIGKTGTKVTFSIPIKYKESL